ncbi:unnamed protein product [Blepharisma stoltei]|uniref:Uncharacterized protein n=1 Tax=Blepharisma stoltei TaxID=1481888 RepID=A0AAU9J239_9CILI|nr:unnamed protein product [Blepharisma stoltei]
MLPAKGNSTDVFSRSSFQIEGEIHYKYAEFTLKSTYKNLSSNAIEGEIIIPIISDFQLYNFLCKIDGKSCDTSLVENTPPLKTYDNAAIDQKNKYILQQLEKSDLYLFNLGLIEPNSEISYEISYACKTEEQLVENTFKLKIPHEFFQHVDEEDKEILSGRFVIKNPLSDQTETHDLEIGNYIVLDNKHYAAALQNIDRKQDLEITYYYETPKVPFVIVQEDPRTNRHAFHLSYTPDKSLTNLSGWEQKGEFVLILDRSGSMSGARIKLAREAAALFIRSLPEDSFFNIVSFGSSYNKMYNENKKYDSCTVEEATRTVIQYDANMGGTNIYDPIKFVLESPRKPGYPLSIFLLTDGDVERRDQVLNIIKDKRDGARISTIGIGNDYEILINQAAKEGNGVAYRIKTENEIKPAVIGSLKQSLIPALTNIQLSDYSKFDFVNPSTPFHIYAGSSIDIAGIWKAGVFPEKIYFQYYSEIIGVNENVDIEINQDEIVSHSAIIAIEGKNWTGSLGGNNERMNLKVIDYLGIPGLVKYLKKPASVFGTGGLFGNTAFQGGLFGNTANQGGLFGNTANQGGLFGNAQNQGGLFGNTTNQGGMFGNTANTGGLFGNAVIPPRAASRVKRAVKPKVARAKKPQPQAKQQDPQSPATARTLRSSKKVPEAAIPTPATKRRRVAQKKLIKQAMKIDQFMIPKNKIQRIVRDFSDDVVPNMRIKQDAYKAFQEAAEAYLIEVFTMSNDVADDNKRITVRDVDIQEAIKKIDNEKMDIEEEEEKKPKGRGKKQAVVKEESESEEEQPSRRTRSGRKFSEKKIEPKKVKKQAKTPFKVAKKEESEEEMPTRVTRSGKKISANQTQVKKQTKPKKEIDKEESQNITAKSPKKPQRKIDVTVFPQKRGRGKNDNPDPPTKKIKNPNDINTASEQTTQPQTPISPPAYTPCSNPCIDVGYEVEKLMHLQKIDGHWSSSSDLSDIINNLVCSKIDITNMNDKRTTALVVAVLDERCHDYICLWDLVAVKARRWMGKNKQSEMKLADF